MQIARAEESISLEYRVKAVCLYNFVKFIEWEKDSFEEEGDITICVIGKNPFGAVTKELDGREAQGRLVRVSEISANAPAEDLYSCDLAYLGSDGTATTALLAEPGTFGVATVSDTNPNAVIKFEVVDGKVKFAVNLEQAERARLKVSAQLLKLAINTQ